MYILYHQEHKQRSSYTPSHVYTFIHTNVHTQAHAHTNTHKLTPAFIQEQELQGEFLQKGKDNTIICLVWQEEMN